MSLGEGNVEKFMQAVWDSHSRKNFFDLVTITHANESPCVQTIHSLENFENFESTANAGWHEACLGPQFTWNS
jgi:uncharacterized phage-associated protein